MSGKTWSGGGAGGPLRRYARGSGRHVPVSELQTTPFSDERWGNGAAPTPVESTPLESKPTPLAPLLPPGSAKAPTESGIDPVTFMGGTIGRLVLGYPFNGIQKKLKSWAHDNDIRYGRINNERELSCFPIKLLLRRYPRARTIPGLLHRILQETFTKEELATPLTFKTVEDIDVNSKSRGNNTVITVSPYAISEVLAKDYQTLHEATGISSEYTPRTSLPVCILGVPEGERVVYDLLWDIDELDLSVQELQLSPLMVLPGRR